MVSSHGMLLDRALTREQLDLAFAIGQREPDPRFSRRTLAISLRDLVSEQEAEGKTKKCLTRVWLNPPDEARSAIDWALQNNAATSIPTAVHFGAMLATFPFVGVVAAVLGRAMAATREVHARTVREEVRRIVGDRSAVDVAARKAYMTMVNLGILDKDKQILSLPEHALPVTGFEGWLIHCTVLTRQASALHETSVSSAPELLGITVRSVLGAYPHLVAHAESHGRVFTPK
jgi:hypothetical protein